jgi:cellulose synthase/poly-beta-1,6-N-acetylglucosamine synthase-like glycosyltransferase
MVFISSNGLNSDQSKNYLQLVIIIRKIEDFERSVFNSILIAIPVYNEAPFVAHVLQQVLEQVPAHCVVVVDDGSTD